MNITTATLPKILKSKTFTNFLLHGDEFVLVRSASIYIKQHFTDFIHHNIIVDKNFDWRAWQIDSLPDLFSEPNIQIMHASSLSFKDKGEALRKYLSQDSHDALIIIAPKLTAAELEPWKNHSKIAVLELKNFTEKQLREWIINRFEEVDKTITSEAVLQLCELYQNNMLALEQEINLLKLTEEKNINHEIILQHAENSAKASLFILFNNICIQNQVKVVENIKSLQEQKAELLPMISFLNNKVLALIDMKNKMHTSSWGIQRDQTEKLLSRFTTQDLYNILIKIQIIDMQFKGAIRSNPWQSFTDLCLALSSNNANMFLQKITN